MNEIINEITITIDSFLLSMGIYAPIFSCLFIIGEAFIPILPLVAFVTVNILAFGFIIGILISWIFTIIGSLLAFLAIKKGLNKKFLKYANKKTKIKKSYDYINKLNLIKLSMIIAIPFSPAFLINTLAGLTSISTKKYLISLIIGKLFLVLFWGIVGNGVYENIRDIKTLIMIGIILLIAYLISYIVNKILMKKEVKL